MTIKYKFGNGRYIRQIDEYNWGVCETKICEKGKNKGKPIEKILAYCGDLPQAKRSAFRIFSLKEGTHKELEELVNKINLIK